MRWALPASDGRSGSIDSGDRTATAAGTAAPQGFQGTSEHPENNPVDALLKILWGSRPGCHVDGGTPLQELERKSGPVQD